MRFFKFANKLIVIVSLLLFVSFWLPFNPIFALAGETTGIYSLGQSFSEEILNHKWVTGLSLRLTWDDIEIENDVYNWTYLDDLIEKGAQHGKKVTIRVIAGKGTPEWVYINGVEKIEYVDQNPNHPTFGETLVMPLPWDEIYLTYWIDFIYALGERYGHIDNAVLIHMTGPCEAGEMHLPEKKNQDFWNSIGYTNDKLITAWSTVIDAYQNAFPDKALGISIAKPLSFGDSLVVVKEVLGYAYEKLDNRLRIQGNWLSAKTSKTFDLYQIMKAYSDYTFVGFQMLSSSSNQERFGGSLQEGIDKGLEANASYLELYRSDVENPDNEEVLESGDYYLKLNAGAYPMNNPPSAPENLKTERIYRSAIILSWDASTDDVSVAEYKVYRDGQEIAVTDSKIYIDKGLIPSTSYTYYIVAYDDKGLESTPSELLTVKTKERRKKSHRSLK